MTTKRVSILRDAEAAFRSCAGLLLNGKRKGIYASSAAGLSADARRLALLLLARKWFEGIEAPAPRGWEEIAREADALEEKDQERLATYFPPLPGDPAAGGVAHPSALSEMGFYYERMKDFEAGSRGGELKIQSSRSNRKRSGTYFTPLSVCDFMVRHALQPALERTGEETAKVLDLKVLDPAMGVGQFLIAASEVMLQALDPQGTAETLYLRRKVFDGCLFGIELDPENVETARFLLGLYTGRRDPALPGIVQGDALLDRQEDSPIFGEEGFPEKIFSGEEDLFDGFDAIVCNPPYVAAKNEPFTKYKPLIAGTTQADVYLFFIHKYAARKYLRPGGGVCFIVPDPLLLRGNAEGARFRLLEGLDLEMLLHVKGIFPRTSVANAIFLARRHVRSKSRSVRVARIERPRHVRAFRKRGEAFLRKTARDIPVEYFRRAPRKEFRYLLHDETGAVLRRLDTGRPAHLGPGIVIRSLQTLTRAKGAVFRGEEIGKERIRALATIESDGGLPVLVGGENIARYAIRDDSLYLPAEHVKKDVNRYQRHKILLQKSTGRIVAALDDRGFVVPQSVYALLINDHRIGYPFLLTQLNSRLLNFFMHVMFTGYKLVQPQIEIEDIRRIPVMVPVFEESPDVRSSSLETAKGLFNQYLRTDDPGWILEYVDDSIKLGSKHGSAMIHDLLDFLGVQMITACSAPGESALSSERLEWLLDLVIYKAFGLELEEIETVESFFTEEEQAFAEDGRDRAGEETSGDDEALEAAVETGGVLEDEPAPPLPGADDPGPLFEGLDR